jgi:hypothetical protein
MRYLTICFLLFIGCTNSPTRSITTPCGTPPPTWMGLPLVECYPADAYAAFDCCEYGDAGASVTACCVAGQGACDEQLEWMQVDCTPPAPVADGFEICGCFEAGDFGCTYGPRADAWRFCTGGLWVVR